MTDEFEVQGFLGPTDEVVFLLHAVELSLEHVDSIHGGVGPHVALDGACLNPFLQDIIDLVFHYLVLRDNLKLQTG